jgi:hypothetical protein
MAVYSFKRPRYVAQPEEPAEKRPRVEPSDNTEETGKICPKRINSETGKS